MPTSGRLKDTLDYLKAEAKKRKNWLTAAEINTLDELVGYHDMIDGGNQLSLGWSWNNSRPSKDLRKAIRALVMISIYNGDIKGSGAGTFATTQKNRSDDAIHNDLKKKIKEFIAAPAIWTKAVRYSLKVRGSTSVRATANAEIQDQNVPLTMAKLKEKNPHIGVMLIDMQSNSDDYSLNTITANKSYDGKSMLEHMVEVLDAAEQLDLIVYDIVIDKDAEVGKPGKVRTIPPLRRAMPKGSKYKFMPKPSYNSFENTPLAEMLKRDKISTLVVMGFHGNLCVKNTIFGTPEYEKTTGQRAMNPTEKQAWLKQHPAPPTGPWKDHEIPKVSVKGLEGYNPGLLDRGIKVVTSRAILASNGAPLEPDYKIISS